MLTMNLGDAGEVIDSIPGVSTLIEYIQGKAKAGAEQAIPDIQAQVKQTVLPYVAIALILGVGGLAIGLKSYYKSKPAAAAASPMAGLFGFGKKRRR